MAALLAGARLVLRQGLRFLPAYRVRPAAMPVRRCLSSSARFLTTAVLDKSAIDVEPFELSDRTQSQSDSWSLYQMGKKLKKNGRISKKHFLDSFEEICKAGKPSSSQAWLLLQACGSLMPGVPPAERTEIADRVWNKMKELGLVFNETHYNMLLKKYIENEHTFSPTEFLASMEAAKVQPNQSTYEALIAAYCKDGDIEGASKILGFMKSTQLPITEEVFSSLITGHARSGDMENAKNILSVMEGSGLIPGKSAYVALLHAYAEKGDIEGIKQTLEDYKLNVSETVYLKVIYSLAKAGHSQLVPNIFEHMQDCKGYLQDVMNLCLMLLTQGYGDTAVLLAKRFVPLHDSDCDFSHQRGNFFLRHCVQLNMPANLIKKYASELQEANLHNSPLQFALLCALEYDKKDMALELMRTLKEKGLPVRPHYCWPLLASFNNEKNIQGVLQVLKVMREMGVQLDFSTFKLYVAKLFEDVESPESLLEEIGFTEGFNKLYLSALREGMSNRNVKHFYSLLSSKIPFVMDRSFMYNTIREFSRNHDFKSFAMITKLLYEDGSRLQKPSHETDSVGYFLRCLIGSMSDSEVQAREERLKQYFHQLEEMGVTIDAQNAGKIIKLLETHNVPQLAQGVKDLTDTAGSISKIEEQIETNIKNIQPSELKLKDLLDKLVAAQDVEKALELTSKDGSHLNFGMYMIILKLCCDQNKPKEALKLKEEIDQRGFTQHPSVSKYLSLVNVLALNGLVEDAINVLTEMHERHVAVSKFSDKSFFHILNQLAIKGDIDAVNKLHEHIVTLNLAKPTSNLCTPLVKVHLNRNELLPALEAMLECQKKYNCCPMEYAMLLKLIEMGETDLLKKAVDGISDALGERQMLLTLLFAFIETGKYAEAQKIVETPGLRAIPKKISWVLERFKMMNKVESLEKCVELTRVLFDCNREEMYFQLLCLYGKNNDWTKAIPLWHKMKEEGIPMKERTLTLFKNIFNQSDQNILVHIPEFLEKNGKATQPDLDEMSRRVEDFCQNKMIPEAYNVFLEAEQNEQRLCKSSYSRLSKGLLYAGLFEDAWKVDEVAKSHFNDSTMDNLFFNRFLAYQVRRDCLKDALVILERMLKNGSAPNQTMLDKLREALAMNGDLDSLEKMEEITSGLKETFPKTERAFHNAKLLAHFKNGNFEEAISTIESLCSKDHNTSIYYLSLTLVKNNMTEALEKLSIVAEMFANQFSIYRPVTDLFIAYAKSGKVEEAKRLLERCSAILEQSEYLKIQINILVYKGQKTQIFQLLDVLGDPLYKHIGYNSLMEQYISTKKFNNAVDLYNRMKAEQIELVEDHLKQLAVLLREADKPVPFPEPQEHVQSFNEEESHTSSPSEDKH